MPAIASPPGHAEESDEPEHDLEEPSVELGSKQQEDQDQQAPLLCGLQGVLGLGAQMRLQGAVAVQPRYGQDIQHERGDLQEAQERHGGPEHRMLRVSQQCGRHQQQRREREVGERAGEADQTSLTLGHERRPHPHRTAGQPDAADGDDQHRQHDREQRIRVLERVQGQIAAHRDVVVAESPRGERVGEFMQAERHHPAGDDEDEDADVGQRPDRVRRKPRQHGTDRRHRDDRQEDRAGSHRLVQRTDVHVTKLPSLG